MLGETTFQPYAINTFSGKGKWLFADEKIHYVHPHYVNTYVRKDGTVVDRYWRDGDGNTLIDRSTGYWAHNPFSLMFGKGTKI